MVLESLQKLERAVAPTWATLDLSLLAGIEQEVSTRCRRICP